MKRLKQLRLKQISDQLEEPLGKLKQGIRAYRILDDGRVL